MDSSNVITRPKINKNDGFIKSVFAFLNLWSQILVLCMKRKWKWLYRVFTGSCELQRICFYEPSVSLRIKKIESCLASSSNAFVQKYICRSHTGIFLKDISEEEFVSQLGKVKHLKLDQAFTSKMTSSLQTINSYNNVVELLERLRLEPFSYENSDHKKQLVEIWNGLVEDRKIDEPVLTKDWTDIGFQGKDPSTDFRGMGMLGLSCLNVMVTRYNKIARYLLARSLHPNHEYHFAITSINVTSWVYKWAVKGDLKSYFYTINHPSIDDFYRVFVLVFIDFNQYWFTKKPNIMQFEQEAKVFCKELHDKLISKESSRLFDSDLDDPEFIQAKFLN